jgi:serine/threonine protein kinase
MLTGRPPFPDGDLTERLLKHVESTPPDIRTLNESVSPKMALVVERMLAKKPEDRQQTPRELYEELKNLPQMSILNSREILEALAGVERKKTKRERGPIIRRRDTPPGLAAIMPELFEEVEDEDATPKKSPTPQPLPPLPIPKRTRRKVIKRPTPVEFVPEDESEPDLDETEPSEPDQGPTRNWPLILATGSGLLLAGAAALFFIMGWQGKWKGKAAAPEIVPQTPEQIAFDRGLDPTLGGNPTKNPSEILIKMSR